MDPGRRRLLVSLALASLGDPLSPLSPARAADAEASPARRLLRVGDGGAPPAAPLRYGAGPLPPVLRARHGEALALTIENRLAGPTSLDLHGIRAAPLLGGAGPLGGTVASGASADVIVMPPDAGTAWFHPWLLDPAADAVAQGLAGLLVVAEAAPPDADADLVALLGDLWVPSGSADGLSVDGSALPRRDTLAPGARVRLRLVNGSTRRAHVVAVRGASPTVVALDGQPSSAFRPRNDAVPLVPGGRCDLVLDLPRTPGAEVTLTAGSDPAGATLMVLRTEGEPRPARGPVPALAPNPALPDAIALERATRATLSAGPAGAAPGGWAINGVGGMPLPRAPLFRARRGSPVVLALRNLGPVLLGFRLHGFCFRLLHERDDGWEPYWRDTVLVQPGATHHAAFVADLPGRWLVESPFFDQAAGGLRAWFEVG